MVIKHSEPFLSKDEIKFISDLIKRETLSTGKIVREFEMHLAKFLGVKASVCTSSGSSALYLILKFLPEIFPELKGTKKVLIPSFTCPAISNAVFMAGYKPVFADINLDTFSLSLEDVKRKISPDTLCVVFIHSFGICSDISDFLDLGVPVIEGIAQAFGGKVSSQKMVGSQGVASFTSFYATKVITTAEGGAVFSNEKSLVEKIRDFIDYDKKDYNPGEFRFNFKMSDIQAGLGLAQMKKIKTILKRRKKIASLYFKLLEDDERRGKVKLPPKKNNIFFRFPVILNGLSSDFVILNLKRKKIFAEKLIFKPLHFFYAEEQNLQNTQTAYEKGISLPIYPNLSHESVRLVSKEFRKQINSRY